MINVQGLTIADIQKIDTNKLSTSDLRVIANRLVSATNKRIRRLRKSKVHSPSLKSLRRINRGRQFSIKHKRFKGKSKASKERAFLQKKISGMKEFLNLKTSTLKGAKKVEKDISKRLGDIYAKMKKSDKNKFWDLYNRIVEERPNIIGTKDKSKSLQNEVLKMYKEELSDEEIKNFAKKFIDDKLSELDETENSEDIDLSDFFELI